jgi:hypothetical protein
MARHVVQEPHRYRTLCMVTPTGFSAPSKVIREGPPGKSREIPGLYKVVSFRPWSQALFDGLASRASIRFFLKRTYGSDDIHEDMFEYDYATAHQPGARFAPLAFLSGRLFSADARDLFRKIELPVWVPHATRGDFKDFSGGDWARERPNWKLHPMPTGALVHFERTGDFLARYRLFLEGPTDA